MPQLELKECPKVYILETHRSKTPDSTLNFVKTMRETVSMLDFRNATDVDRIGIPVFTCDRVRPDNSRTSHTGKGVSEIQAQVSLTMESIERYCSEYMDEYKPNIIYGSYAGLKKKQNILNPEELILSARSNYAPDKDLEWVWGCELCSNEELLVPACAVYHPFHQNGAFLFNSHTNGIAAGNTIEEAVIHGLAEVIERDAWSITRYKAQYSDALFLEDNPGNEFIIKILEKFDAAEIEIVAKDITTDIGIPVVAAFSRDLVHETMVPIDGFGAHLDPRVALIRALLEIATTRALFFQKYGIEGLKEFTTSYLRQGGEYEDTRFYAYNQKGLAELEIGYTDDILKDFHIYREKLSARGLDKIIAVNLTRPDVNVPTVRMIVPGAETYCFDQSRRGERAVRAFEKNEDVPAE
ncbi:MAG: YcaO-like family protein [Syntrophaceae bacterium]